MGTERVDECGDPTAVPAEVALMMLRIETTGDERWAEGFTKAAVRDMFGWPPSFAPRDVLVLVHDGREILRIPWPDGLTLDEALRRWARLET